MTAPARKQPPVTFRGKGLCAADDARAAGLQVGDTIIGKESGPGTYGATWWNETCLKLIFLGEHVCVWRVKSRSHLDENWVDGGESARWNLSCRDWRKLT